MTWPSAMPGANTSVTVHSGMRCRRMIPERHGDRGDQAAVEHAARSHQRQQLARDCCRERVEVDDQQQQLRADQRADDDPDAEVHDPVGIEAARPGAHQRELQAEQVGGGQQHAVGVDREARRSQTGWDAWSSSEADHVEEHEDGADGDRRVGDVERPEVRRRPSRRRRSRRRSRRPRGRSGCRRRRRGSAPARSAPAARGSRAARRRRRSPPARCAAMPIITTGL